MHNTIWAVVRDGRIELMEDVKLTEGEQVLVTLISPEEEKQFWTQASQPALADVWDNPQADIYAQLLEK